MTYNDLIFKRDALNAIKITQSHEPCGAIAALTEAYERIKYIEPAPHSFFGEYKLEQLALIAEVMRMEGISPQEAVQAYMNIGRMTDIILKEQERIFNKTMLDYLGGE